MKILSIFLAACSLLTLNACQSDHRSNEENDNTEVNTEKESPSKLIEGLVGSWERDSSAGDETNNQRITFTSEARYIIYKNDQKIDSGAYRMNEQLHNIYLESEVNEQPREYEISLTRDELRLTPNQPNGQQESASSTYRRAQ